MAYNPFRWYTEGKYRKRPLKKSAPLLLRIQNGDFEYSPFFLESKDQEKLYDDMFQQYMETSKLQNMNDKRMEAHQFAKMKRIKSQKLMEKGLEEEQTRLYELKTELEKEFDKDLWDKCLKKQRGKGTTEDMYWWYKKQVKQGYTKSELKIRGIL
tara:strand:+ start:1098 stop:1562 length:465 start_codon:yes stop_codon:yes gene_type:complete